MPDSRKEKFLSDHLKYIGGLKKPTEQQNLLAVLYIKKDRTPADQKKLNVIIDAEYAAHKAAEAKQAVSSLLKTEKLAASAEARKARNHRLIQLGLLFELAGIDGKDRGELAGALLAVAKTDKPESWVSWKRSGDAALAAQAQQAKATTATQQPASTPKPVTATPTATAPASMTAAHPHPRG